MIVMRERREKIGAHDREYASRVFRTVMTSTMPSPSIVVARVAAKTTACQLDDLRLNRVEGRAYCDTKMTADTKRIRYGEISDECTGTYRGPIMAPETKYSLQLKGTGRFNA